MFYFFYKIITFIVNKENDDIRSAYCKFSQLGDNQKQKKINANEPAERRREAGEAAAL